jgi:phage shock protein C
MITHMSDPDAARGRPLLRRRDGRLWAGVCTGLAAYLRIDVNLVRLAFGILTVFYGLGVLIYLAAWAVLPEEGEKESILESFVHRF